MKKKTILFERKIFEKQCEVNKKNVLDRMIFLILISIQKVFVVLALCVCAASATFSSLLGGGGSGSSSPKIVKIINIDGGSGGSSGWSSGGSSSSAHHHHHPDQIVKVIHVQGDSHSSHDSHASHASHGPAPVKIIKVHIKHIILIQITSRKLRKKCFICHILFFHEHYNWNEFDFFCISKFKWAFDWGTIHLYFSISTNFYE